MLEIGNLYIFYQNWRLKIRKIYIFVVITKFIIVNTLYTSIGIIVWENPWNVRMEWVLVNEERMKWCRIISKQKL